MFEDRGKPVRIPLFRRAEKRRTPLYVYLTEEERAELEAVAAEFQRGVRVMTRDIIVENLRFYREVHGSQGGM